MDIKSLGFRTRIIDIIVTFLEVYVFILLKIIKNLQINGDFIGKLAFICTSHPVRGAWIEMRRGCSYRNLL